MPLFGPPNVEEMKAQGDVKGLIQALDYEKSGDEHVRSAAVEALVKIGAPAIEPLIAALQDEDEGLHNAAAAALARFGPEAVEPLLAALKVGHVIRIRIRIARALVNLGLPAVEPLIAALKDSKMGLRGDVAIALGQLGDARAVEPLIAALKDNDKDVGNAVAVANALDRLGWCPGEDESGAWYWIVKQKWDQCSRIGSPAVEPLITALQDRNMYVSKAAAYVLGKLGDARAVAPLIAALQDSNGNVREAAAMALDQLGWRPGQDENGACYWIAHQKWDRCINIGASAIEPLITVAFKYPRRDVHEAVIAANALRRLGWRPGQDENGACYWIAHREWDQCIMLGALAVEPLIAALQDRDEDMRKKVADALGKLGDARAVAPLIAALQDNTGASASAAYALGELGDACAVEPLIAALHKDDWRRVAVAHALGELGDPRAVEPLIAALEDSDEDVRSAVADALVRIGWRPGEDENVA
jgi:HEAT repeat protein